MEAEGAGAGKRTNVNGFRPNGILPVWMNLSMDWTVRVEYTNAEEETVNKVPE